MAELPTIGIEIELPWKVMLARVDETAAQLLRESDGFYSLGSAARERVQRGFDAVDEQYKDLVQSAFGEDIQQKSDGYTEFAFNPKRSYAEIAEVAQDLYETGILCDGETYPLHVTLGGIAAKNASWLILMAAELSGGASPSRMTETGTWSQKGEAGMRQRGARELALDAKVAIEMRSLEARGFDELQNTLAICQNAGGLLLGKLAGEAASVDRWRDLYWLLMDMTEQKGVDARTRWKNPHIDITPWESVAKALDDEAWAAAVKNGVAEILL